MSAGDTVGFWVEVNGNKYYSVNSMNGNSVDVVDWKINKGELLLDFNVGGDQFSDIKIVVTAQAAKTPTGQPLPGLFLTLTICGTPLFLRRLFKRK